MTTDDAAAVLDIMREVWDLPVTEAGFVRVRHLVETDPAGAWVTTGDDGAVDGAALALVREGIWGLSLLIVRPDRQSEGRGRALMAEATAYGAGSRGGIILASDDPRALRAYWRAGFELRPSFDALGPVRTPPPADAAVREGRWPQDRDLVDAVSRHVRGAAHGTDIEAMRAAGRTLLVHDGGGFAFHEDGRVPIVAARDERVARALLETALHRTPGASIDFLDARQQWAIDTALTAGMTLKPTGSVCVRGEVGPLRPYIPSGAYL